MKKKHSKLWLTILPMYFFTILFIVAPLIYMVALSFATNESGHRISWAFTLDNYKLILEPVYFSSFVQSFELALLSTAIIALLGYPFGYFMAKLSSSWKQRLILLITVPFWVNSLIRLYGWIILLQGNGPVNNLLRAIGLIDKPLKLLYSYPAVLLGMVYALLPFMILSVYSSAEKLDWSLIEAARDLGAGRWQAFRNISLKLTLPGLLSGIVLTFVPSMGLFFIANILGGNKFVIVGNVIEDQMTRRSNWPFAAALAVILTIFTSLMIFLYRKISKSDELEGLY